MCFRANQTLKTQLGSYSTDWLNLPWDEIDRMSRRDLRLLLGIHLLPFENNFTSSCSADWHFYNKQPRWQNHSQWSSWFWEWAALYFVCYCKGKPTDAIEFDVCSPAWGRFKWLVYVQINFYTYWKRISCLMMKICSLKSDVQIRQMLGRNSTSAQTVYQYVFTHVDRKGYSYLNNT